jgi:serine phosphatase RsbU (regulator of sigma subunit)/anti-sigma regulatory factor (Ser/Thr protein kinase)
VQRPAPGAEAGALAVVHERLARLQWVGARLIASRTTSDVVAVVLDEMAESVGAAAATLSLLHDDGCTVEVAGARGFPEEVVARWATFGLGSDAPMAVAMATRTPVLCGSGAEVVDRFPALADDIRTSRREALVALPLTADGMVLGAIGLGFDHQRTFDDDERRFFESLALQCAVALDRSRAYEAEAAARGVAEVATRRLAFAAEAGSVLASSLDWERTIARVAELAVPRLADLCAISLESGGEIEVVKVAHVDDARGDRIMSLYRTHRPRLSDDVGVGAVIRTGIEVLLPEVHDHMLRAIAMDEDHLEDLRAVGLGSLIVVPLLVGSRGLGALSFGAVGDRRLGLEDLVLGRELAARASQAIANAQLYAERAHVARTLQATLLPPTTPRIAGMEVASRFVAGGDAVEVGGDFYDVFPTGHGRGSWHAVIGDVRGKGVEAAALTGVARTTMRSAAIYETSPAGMLRHLNEVLVRMDPTAVASDDGDPRFCTMVVGTLTPDEGGVGVELAVAGHPLPFVLRADGTTEQVGVAGTLLGIVADPEITDARLHLAPGDALVLYTDGITERHARDRFFEEEGLARVLARCAGFTAATLAERIETAARAFVEDAPRDDLAVLVLRVPARPASTTLASTDLPAHALSARRARRFVLAALEALGVRAPAIEEVAELLTSEVVTNAVLHAGSGVRVLVEGMPGGVRISVTDTDPQMPALRPPADQAESGRGLHLVDTLADRWGVAPAPTGKAVWFELAVEQAHG